MLIAYVTPNENETTPVKYVDPQKKTIALSMPKSNTTAIEYPQREVVVKNAIVIHKIKTGKNGQRIGINKYGEETQIPSDFAVFSKMDEAYAFIEIHKIIDVRVETTKKFADECDFVTASLIQTPTL